MAAFFQSIIDFFGTIFSIISSLLDGLLHFLGMIPSVFSFLGTMYAYVPSFLSVFFAAGISSIIILLIIGRQHD